MQKNDITRFTEMYQRYYEQVEGELRNGRKESHWMWFIFPQIKGLGHGETAVYYAIKDLEEAKDFLASCCGTKMQNLLKILLSLKTDNPESIFGHVDALKLASSMTLFAIVDSGNTIYQRVLDKFYAGKMDDKTLDILNRNKKGLIYMKAQDFLTKFLPAYDRGDMATLHELRQKIFEETVQIVKHGSYTTEKGQPVTLPEPPALMTGSQLYSSVDPVNLPEQSQQTIIEVKDCDSLLAGKQLLDEGYHPAVLNFANRQTAGGGVLGGSGAQEENMFRRSNLFLSLYQFHHDGVYFDVPQRAEQYPMDRTTGGAYSPNVTVFRGLEPDGYPLLQNPYAIGVITVAAMNRPELKNQYQIANHLVEPTKEKMRTIFRIALKHGHDALVLGAWGCGAFKNPPQHIAKLFHQVMDENEFHNRFKKIVFAIVDRRNLEIGPSKVGNLLPFQEEFATQAAKNCPVVIQKNKTELFNRFKGMFWGLVVGDCFGSPIQFTGKDEHPYITEMRPCTIFNVPAGYWTDDSSMAFCVAESLVRLGKCDLKDIGENFVRWYKDGFCSSKEYAFDIGRATHLAMFGIQNGCLKNGKEESQGNGSIMRFAPSYIWNYGAGDNRILHEISDLTHASNKVRETVDLMTHICDEHLTGKRTGIKSIYNSRDEVNNSGWAVSTLQAALWAFETTSTFEDGMIAAVNLGGDSDSIGAVYGQIAGAYYGFEGIPSRWVNAVKDQQKVNDLIENLVRLKVGRA